MFSIDRAAVLVLAVCGLAALPAAAWAGSPAPRTSVLLAPAVAEGKPSALAQGVFYSNTVSVQIGDGAVLLASTPDGSGNSRTDDQATLVVQRPDGTQSHWLRDFRDPATGAIGSAGPEDVTALFQSGANTVTVALIDLVPPVHSSTPYYLVFSPAPGTAEAAPATRSVAATAMPATLIAVNTVPVATRHTPNPAIAPTAAPAPPAPVQQHSSPVGISRTPSNATAESSREVPTYMPVVLIAAVVLIAGFVIIRQRQKAVPADALFGIVNLYDTVTGEHCERVDLTQFRGAVAILQSPLRVEKPRKGLTPLATLQRDVEGMCCQTVTAEGNKTIALRDMEELKIGGRVLLEFRTPTTHGSTLANSIGEARR